MLKNAKWIKSPVDMVMATAEFRKSFSIKNKVKSATLYASAAGLYCPKLNGERITDAVLMPGLTSYKTRVLYQEYDVTELCRGGGVTIGSETSASIRNIWVHDCYFEQVMVGINVKTMKGRGGVVENIDFENIEMNHAVREAIRISMKYAGEPLDDQSQGNHYMPIVRNISINNFVCHRALRPTNITGVKYHEVQNITISNSTIHCEESGVLENVKGLMLDNVEILQNFD